MRTVKITNDTGIVADTKIFDGESGIELTNCVESLVISMDSRGGVVKAEVRLLFIKVDIVGAQAEFRALDPSTGALRKVAKITFAEGDELVL